MVHSETIYFIAKSNFAEGYKTDGYGDDYHEGGDIESPRLSGVRFEALVGTRHTHILHQPAVYAIAERSATIETVHKLELLVICMLT